MKLNRATLALVIAAVTLASFVAISESQRSPQPTTEQASEQKKLFSLKEADVQAFTVQTNSRTLKFEKGADGKWQMLEPETAPASEASIAFILNLLATGTSERTVTVPVAELNTFGFGSPLATIDFTLNDKQTHRIIIGGHDFNRTSLYAQVDPPANPQGEVAVQLVSLNFENAVGRSLKEWKAESSATPAASPTPSPSPSTPAPSPTTESPAPETSPSATPTPPASPSPEATSSPSPSPTTPQASPEATNTPTPNSAAPSPSPTATPVDSQ